MDTTNTYIDADPSKIQDPYLRKLVATKKRYSIEHSVAKEEITYGFSGTLPRFQTICVTGYYPSYFSGRY